jgi:hypothetical protein
MEDSTGYSGIGDFCSFDTLYKLELINTSDKKTDVYFSHLDLERNQLRVVKDNKLHLIKLSKRIAPVLKKYLKELFAKINNFTIPCTGK